MRTEIHTSDRILYKRCRRKWDWGSQMREGLVPTQGVISRPLWFGSGFHYAMEDFFGYRKHGDLLGAFRAYINSFKESELPDLWEDDLELADGMFKHYHRWQKGREEFRTVWLDKRPLVELEVHVPLPADVVGREDVVYSGTIDRVVSDEFGQLWLLDYKTTANFDTSKLEMDPQVSAYCFAAREVFNLDVSGMVYLQFRKKFPEQPTLLKSGKFSLNKAQNTSYDLYKEALFNLYGGSDRWRAEVPEYVEFLNSLLDGESEQGDKYIRCDKVFRSPEHINSVYEQILVEAREMCDPAIPIYPNPTKDCSWDCPFRAPCIAKDDGSDYQYILDEMYVRENVEDRNKGYRDKEDWSTFFTVEA